MALSLQELMAAWVAVATVTLSEYRRQCWRLAGLACSDVVEALMNRVNPPRPQTTSRMAPNNVRQKCSLGNPNGQWVRKKLVFR